MLLNITVVHLEHSTRDWPCMDPKIAGLRNQRRELQSCAQQSCSVSATCTPPVGSLAWEVGRAEKKWPRVVAGVMGSSSFLVVLVGLWLIQYQSEEGSVLDGTGLFNLAAMSLAVPAVSALAARRTHPSFLAHCGSSCEKDKPLSPSSEIPVIE